MLSPSDFNNAVPQFTNGNYASNPINPQYVEEPTSTDYNHGVEPLQTLPAQWWNWFLNKFTARFNKVNVYVKNIFNELTQLLSLFGMTPDGTEGTPTTEQLKTAFCSCYPSFVKSCITGTACGCVPTIGVAMGSTDGNIVATDASGNLKPTNITVGTAAGCNASCFLQAGCAVPMANAIAYDLIDPDTGLVCGCQYLCLSTDCCSDYPGTTYVCISGLRCTLPSDEEVQDVHVGYAEEAVYANKSGRTILLTEEYGCVLTEIGSYCAGGPGGCNCVSITAQVSPVGVSTFYSACVSVDCATSANFATCANALRIQPHSSCNSLICMKCTSSSGSTYWTCACTKANMLVIPKAGAKDSVIYAKSGTILYGTNGVYGCCMCMSMSSWNEGNARDCFYKCYYFVPLSCVID